MEELVQELLPHLNPNVDKTWIEVLVRKFGNRQFDRGREVGEWGREHA